MENFGIYVIISNPTLSYKKIAETCVKNSVKMLQLRERNIFDKDLIRVGKEIRNITRGTETNFVINDRPDIAAICEADYLHLGQDDIDIADARHIVGNMKIGLSTHSLEQAKSALSKNPDYIGFGPIYPTNAKAKPDSPVGTENLRSVLSFANVPVVAIGGIFPENIKNIVEAGAKNVALVRYLMQDTNFDNKIKELQNLLK